MYMQGYLLDYFDPHNIIPYAIKFFSWNPVLRNLRSPISAELGVLGVELRNTTLRFALLAEREHENIKYFISSSRIRTHKVSRFSTPQLEF